MKSQQSFSRFRHRRFGKISFSRRSGETNIEGVLKGNWLRPQSSETLGDLSKVTFLDPLRLVVGDQSLPLLGGTEELEQTLVENSGKTVRTQFKQTWPFNSLHGLNRERFEAALPVMALIQDRVNKTFSILHVFPSA